MHSRSLTFSRACLILGLAAALSGCPSSDGGSDSGPTALFGSPIITDLGGAPAMLAWGDFNGDGKVDAIYGRIGDGSAYVMLGNGNGSFQPAHLLGEHTGGAAVGDLNGDGRIDLAVIGCADASCPLGGLSLFTMLGNGDGTFQAPVACPGTTGASGLSIADINGDGRPDVVVTISDRHVAQVLLGNGDGTLKAPTEWPTQSPFVRPTLSSVAIADMNGDARPDLVIYNAAAFVGSDVAVLLGHGDGTFELPVAFGLVILPIQQVITDFNRDGRLDVAITGGHAGPPGGPGAVVILLGKGDGTFGSTPTPQCLVSPCNGAMAAGDIDGDGIPDLIVQQYPANELSILYGKGDGTFLAPQSFTLSLSGSVDQLRDLDGDGRPDLVLTTPTGIAVLLKTR